MASSKSQLSKYVIGDILKPVTKAYHSKYLYKAELYVPGAWFLRCLGKDWTIHDLSTYISERQNLEKIKRQNVNDYSFSNYVILGHDDLMDSKYKHIWELHELQTTLKGKISTRIERSTFSIYAKTEQELLDIFTTYTRIAKCVRHIYAPIDDETASKLKDDVIFQKSPKFKFKISIREAQYPLPIKQQIFNYLQNHIGDISIPYALRARLESKYSSYMYGYFYTNDDSLLTFLKMISPDFVRKIYRIESL